MTVFTFVLAVLAVNAAAFAISVEDVSEPFRTWLQDHGWEWVPDDETIITPDGGRNYPRPGAGVWRWFYELFSCPRCTGFWLTIPATFVFLGPPDGWGWFLVFWAIYGAHLALTTVLVFIKGES